MNAKTTTSLIALLMLLPATTVLADTTGTRTFYLPDDPSAEMGETPPSGERSATNTQLEFRGGAPYGRLTAASTDWTFLPIADAFDLHIAHRTALVPGPSTFTTAVRVFALDSAFEQVPIASALVTFEHPGGDIGDAEGWTDIRFDADPAGPFVTGSIVALPPGTRLALEFSIRDGLGLAPGAAFADIVRGTTATVDDTDVIPSTIPGCTLAACGVVDPEAIVLGQMNAFADANAQNIDNLAGIARVPASTFEVMDPADPARLVVRTVA